LKTEPQVIITTNSQTYVLTEKEYLEVGKEGGWAKANKVLIKDITEISTIYSEQFKK
jgi:hypothetical protein